MKAARIHGFGSPEVIAIEEIATPAPSQDSVLIQVFAAGVGPWDAWIRSGQAKVSPPLPLTLGAELAGLITATGSQGGGFAVGEAVFGATNENFIDAYAEYAVASSHRLARIPKSLNFVEAASVPVVAVTALQLLETTRVSAGQSLLIHGAAGNVGAYAVQLAMLQDVNVMATVQSDNDVSYLKTLGVRTIIDTRSNRFEDVVGLVDVVIDLVGGAVQGRSFAVVRPGGYLISSVSVPDAAEATRRGIRSSFLLVDVSRSDLERLLELFNQGKLRTRVGSILPLDAARVSHQMLAGTTRHEPGKIVLEVRPSGSLADAQ